MDFDFVVNPAGASGRTLSFFQKKVIPLFQDVHYHIHYSSRECSISSICKELTQRQQTTNLILCGGDGSLFEAVNGIANFEKTRIGLIPCGSGNDFAKDMQLPAKLEELVNRIKQGKTQRTIDLGEVIFHSRFDEMDHQQLKILNNESHEEYRQYFNVSCGMGFDAKTCQQVFLSKTKHTLNQLHLGKLIYLFVALRLIFENEQFHCQLTYDNQKIDVPHCFFAVGMNHRFEGGGFQFCPEAKDQDGYLDGCVAKDIHPTNFLRILPFSYTGGHVRYKKQVTIVRSQTIHIQSDKPMWVHTDGEVYYKSNDITLNILPGKLHLLF